MQPTSVAAPSSSSAASSPVPRSHQIAREAIRDMSTGQAASFLLESVDHRKLYQIATLVMARIRVPQDDRVTSAVKSSPVTVVSTSSYGPTSAQTKSSGGVVINGSRSNSAKKPFTIKRCLDHSKRPGSAPSTASKSDLVVAFITPSTAVTGPFKLPTTASKTAVKPLSLVHQLFNGTKGPKASSSGAPKSDQDRLVLPSTNSAATGSASVTEAPISGSERASESAKFVREVPNDAGLLETASTEAPKLEEALSDFTDSGVTGPSLAAIALNEESHATQRPSSVEQVVDIALRDEFASAETSKSNQAESVDTNPAAVGSSSTTESQTLDSEVVKESADVVDSVGDGMEHLVTAPRKEHTESDQNDVSVAANPDVIASVEKANSVEKTVEDPVVTGSSPAMKTPTANSETSEESVDLVEQVVERCFSPEIPVRAISALRTVTPVAAGTDQTRELAQTKELNVETCLRFLAENCPRDQLKRVADGLLPAGNSTSSESGGKANSEIPAVNVDRSDSLSVTSVRISQSNSAVPPPDSPRSPSPAPKPRKRTPSSVRIYQCPDCPYEGRAEGFRAHLACHKGKGAFTCSVCTFSSTKSCVTRHYNLLHRDESQKPRFGSVVSKPSKSRDASPVLAPEVKRPDSKWRYSIGCWVPGCDVIMWRNSEMEAHTKIHPLPNESASSTMNIPGTIPNENGKAVAGSSSTGKSAVRNTPVQVRSLTRENATVSALSGDGFRWTTGKLTGRGHHSKYTRSRTTFAPRPKPASVSYAEVSDDLFLCPSCSFKGKNWRSLLSHRGGMHKRAQPHRRPVFLHSDSSAKKAQAKKKAGNGRVGVEKTAEPGPEANGVSVPTQRRNANARAVRTPSRYSPPPFAPNGREEIPRPKGSSAKRSVEPEPQGAFAVEGPATKRRTPVATLYEDVEPKSTVSEFPRLQAPVAGRSKTSFAGRQIYHVGNFTKKLQVEGAEKKKEAETDDESGKETEVEDELKKRLAQLVAAGK